MGEIFLPIVVALIRFLPTQTTLRCQRWKLAYGFSFGRSASFFTSRSSLHFVGAVLDGKL